MDNTTTQNFASAAFARDDDLDDSLTATREASPDGTLSLMSPRPGQMITNLSTDIAWAGSGDDADNAYFVAHFWETHDDPHPAMTFARKPDATIVVANRSDLGPDARLNPMPDGSQALVQVTRFSSSGHVASSPVVPFINASTLALQFNGEGDGDGERDDPIEDRKDGGEDAEEQARKDAALEKLKGKLYNPWIWTLSICGKEIRVMRLADGSFRKLIDPGKQLVITDPDTGEKFVTKLIDATESNRTTLSKKELFCVQRVLGTVPTWWEDYLLSMPQDVLLVLLAYRLITGDVNVPKLIMEKRQAGLSATDILTDPDVLLGLLIGVVSGLGAAALGRYLKPIMSRLFGSVGGKLYRDAADEIFDRVDDVGKKLAAKRKTANAATGVNIETAILELQDKAEQKLRAAARRTLKEAGEKATKVAVDRIVARDLKRLKDKINKGQFGS